MNSSSNHTNHSNEYTNSNWNFGGNGISERLGLGGLAGQFQETHPQRQESSNSLLSQQSLQQRTTEKNNEDGHFFNTSSIMNPLVSPSSSSPMTTPWGFDESIWERPSLAPKVTPSQLQPSSSFGMNGNSTTHFQNPQNSGSYTNLNDTFSLSQEKKSSSGSIGSLQRTQPQYFPLPSSASLLQPNHSYLPNPNQVMGARSQTGSSHDLLPSTDHHQFYPGNEFAYPHLFLPSPYYQQPQQNFMGAQQNQLKSYQIPSLASASTIPQSISHHHHHHHQHHPSVWSVHPSASIQNNGAMNQNMVSSNSLVHSSNSTDSNTMGTTPFEQSKPLFIQRESSFLSSMSSTRETSLRPKENQQNSWKLNQISTSSSMTVTRPPSLSHTNTMNSFPDLNKISGPTLSSSSTCGECVNSADIITATMVGNPSVFKISTNAHAFPITPSSLPSTLNQLLGLKMKTKFIIPNHLKHNFTPGFKPMMMTDFKDSNQDNLRTLEKQLSPNQMLFDLPQKLVNSWSSSAADQDTNASQKKSTKETISQTLKRTYSGKVTLVTDPSSLSYFKTCSVCQLERHVDQLSKETEPTTCKRCLNSNKKKSSSSLLSCSTTVSVANSTVNGNISVLNNASSSNNHPLSQYLNNSSSSNTNHTKGNFGSLYSQPQQHHQLHHHSLYAYQNSGALPPIVHPSFVQTNMGTTMNASTETGTTSVSIGTSKNSRKASNGKFTGKPSTSQLVSSSTLVHQGHALVAQNVSFLRRKGSDLSF